MGRKEYLEKRQAMLNEAKQLINSGKIDEGNEKMKEIKALDERFEAEANANAALEAMERETAGLNIQNLTDSAAEGRLDGRMTPGSVIQMDGKNPEEETPVMRAYASEAYKNAWAKTLMNLSLTKEEQQIYQMVNEAYTHTTGNTQLVIPKTVTKGIWEEAGEIYPYFGDTSKTYVNGVLSMVQEDASSDAKWYDEPTPTEDGKETFKEFTLDGCELSRAITVSWKLKEMAVEDFIPYIQRKMAKKMGAALGYGSTHGAGKSGSGKPEPTGVVTALEKETGTPQIIAYAGTEPTYKELTTARSKIKSGYSAGLAIYANSTTIWTKLANVLDANNRPLFMPDPAAGGLYRVLGMLVKEDDSMKDGEILISNPGMGYAMNINKEMTMLPEEHVKDRKTDYCGYAIADGNATTTKAHALLIAHAGE